MALIIELPHVGESVVEGTIGKWLKKPGDQIERYDPLVEIVTDKVTMEMPSPVSGVLSRIIAEEGETVPMGAPIAEFETADSPPTSAEKISPEPEATLPGTSGDGVAALGAGDPEIASSREERLYHFVQDEPLVLRVHEEELPLDEYYLELHTVLKKLFPKA